MVIGIVASYAAFVIRSVEKNFNTKIENVNKDIERHREDLDELYTLLREQGEKLAELRGTLSNNKK